MPNLKAIAGGLTLGALGVIPTFAWQLPDVARGAAGSPEAMAHP